MTHVKRHYLEVSSKGPHLLDPKGDGHLLELPQDLQLQTEGKVLKQKGLNKKTCHDFTVKLLWVTVSILPLLPTFLIQALWCKLKITGCIILVHVSFDY